MELVHIRCFQQKIAVNNLYPPIELNIDYIDFSALSTRSSQAFIGEQAVHINSLKELKNLLISSQFIERTKRAVESKIKVVRFQDNPA